MVKTCFKTYDIRGITPYPISNDFAYLLGRAVATFLKARYIIVGQDIRLSSQSLAQNLIKGLTESGVNVIHIGLCGSEEVYFATCLHKTDGGIMITASHNPANYNGFKIVSKQARPVSITTGLHDIYNIIEQGNFKPITSHGKVTINHDKTPYIQKLVSYIDKKLPTHPMKIVTNAGHGCAGPILDLLEVYFPDIHFIKLNNAPDGTFPDGVPNPLLKETRSQTQAAIIKHKANLGIAWDGDFDRCFFYDHTGKFIESYYLIGLFSEILLKKQPRQSILTDTRLVWNSLEIIKKNGGIPVQTQSGHALMKNAMRIHDALYGGETSGHHYFKDFFYCDSGMIPWLILVQHLMQHGTSLKELIKYATYAYPCSGEINFSILNANDVITHIENYFNMSCINKDHIDGLSMYFDTWRFNLRHSHTEPLIRLNIETKGNKKLLQEKIIMLTALIKTIARAIS